MPRTAKSSTARSTISCGSNGLRNRGTGSPLDTDTDTTGQPVDTADPVDELCNVPVM